MRKLLLVVTIGAAVISSFAMAACVGDEPSTVTTGGTAQGQLGGACFANGTCNTGLACNVVEGAAKCAVVSGGVPSGDASTDAPPPTGTTDSGTPGPTVCTFQTTKFPCGGQQPPTACYGATQSCTLTGCNPSDLVWECNSDNQCSGVCCVPTAAATLVPGIACTEGKLLITDAAVSGAACQAAAACSGGATQLCQSNSECPPGERCAPVKIVSSAASLDGTIVAACVK